MLRWAADTAAVWKACTKKLSAVSRQLSVGSKAPLARVGLFFGAAAREGHDFSRAAKESIHAALAAEGQESSLNPGNAEE